MPERQKKPSNLFLRFAIGIPVGMLAVWFFAFGDLSLFFFVVAGAWIAMREFWQLVRVDQKSSAFPLSLTGEVGMAFFLYAVWAYPSMPLDVLLIGVYLPLLLLVQLFTKARSNKPFSHDVCAVMLGILYIGGFLSYLFRLRSLEIQLVQSGAIAFDFALFQAENMSHLIIFPVVGSWCCDTAAYFSGRYFGKRKLAPTISPGKTWVGLAGGMVGSAAGVTAYAASLGLFHFLAPWKLALFGALAGGVSQLGDLTMSAFKREAGVKDSGRILGAHGGMLDRIDGFLWSLPATYIFFIVALR